MWKYLLVYKAKVSERSGGVTPVLLHLYPSLKIDLCAHELLNIVTCLLTDLFKHGTLLADYNALVAVFFAENCNLKINNSIIAFRELGDLDGGSVGNLLLKAAQQLFTHKLSANLTLRLVGYHVIREKMRAFNSIFIKLFKELVAKENITIVMTTHDPSMMEVADKVYTLEDGVVVDE